MKYMKLIFAACAMVMAACASNDEPATTEDNNQEQEVSEQENADYVVLLRPGFKHYQYQLLDEEGYEAFLNMYKFEFTETATVKTNGQTFDIPLEDQPLFYDSGDPERDWKPQMHECDWLTLSATNVALNFYFDENDGDTAREFSVTYTYKGKEHLIFFRQLSYSQVREDLTLLGFAEVNLDRNNRTIEVPIAKGRDVIIDYVKETSPHYWLGEVTRYDESVYTPSPEQNEQFKSEHQFSHQYNRLLVKRKGDMLELQVGDSEIGLSFEIGVSDGESYMVLHGTYMSRIN